MGSSLAPERYDVVLSVKLAKLAGFKTATCRYLGTRQQGNIDLESNRLQADRRKAIGEDWAGRMVEKVGKVVDDAEKAQIERLAKLKREKPSEWGLARYPADLVCRQVIKALDGEAVKPEQVEAWLDDGPHPDVTKKIASTMLAASGLIPETESARGEGSGGSSAA